MFDPWISASLSLLSTLVCIGCLKRLLNSLVERHTRQTIQSKVSRRL